MNNTKGYFPFKGASKNPKFCVTRSSKNPHLPRVSSGFSKIASLDFGIFRSSLKATATVALFFLATFAFGSPNQEENSQWDSYSYEERYRISAGAVQPSSEKSKELTDAARLLAGFEVDASSNLKSIESTDAWKTHKTQFDKIWKDLDSDQFTKLRAWAAKEVDPLPGSHGNAYYPFSGPDFLYIYYIYPNAKSYTLSALEPAGDIPDLKSLNPQQLQTSLNGLHKSLDDILGYSFFRTLSMAVDFKLNELKGTIPILMVFLAKTNHEIIDVNYVGLDKGASVKVLTKAEINSDENKLIPGVRIDFRQKGSDEVKQLYYWNVDISDSGLTKTPEYYAFVKKLRRPCSYMKAASYLMHRETFSIVRNIVLTESSIILEDDSGIPVRYFRKDLYNRKFYGNYIEPIPLFSSRHQKDLRAIFVNKTETIYPLDFGIGYSIKADRSHLLLATPK